VKDFFQRKHQRKRKLSRKLYSALKITHNSPFCVAFVEFQLTPDVVLKIDTTDGPLFLQQGNFPTHGFSNSAQQQDCNSYRKRHLTVHHHDRNRSVKAKRASQFLSKALSHECQDLSQNLNVYAAVRRNGQSGSRCQDHHKGVQRAAGRHWNGMMLPERVSLG
jgi:hypothetical protein